jgi:gas vesicle protein
LIIQSFPLFARCAAVCGLLAIAGVARGAEAPAKPAGAAELAKLVDLANQQRDRMIAEHDALARQLKDATEEKRKEIYEKMSEQKKAFEAAQSALHKRIREEQRAQRALQRSR